MRISFLSTMLTFALGVVLASSQAWASILMPIDFPEPNDDPTVITPSTTPKLEISDNDNLNASDVEVLVMTGGLLFELYKQDVGGAESGSFAGSYTTSFFNDPDDPEDATITWVVGEPKFNSVELFLLVKDGNQDPAQYLFNVSEWDRMTTLMLDDFWPDQGAISHIAFYGGEGPDTQDVVPEATSLVVWGVLAAVCGVGARRRRFV